jgi:hypothetical protein
MTALPLGVGRRDTILGTPFATELTLCKPGILNPSPVGAVLKVFKVFTRNRDMQN